MRKPVIVGSFPWHVSALYLLGKERSWYCGMMKSSGEFIRDHIVKREKIIFSASCSYSFLVSSRIQIYACKTRQSQPTHLSLSEQKG